MDLDEMNKELVEIRERVVRTETIIENLIKQQTAIDKLAIATQEMAVSLKGVTTQTDLLSKQIMSIEEDKKKKHFSVWSTIVGLILGGIATIVINSIVN